MNKKIGSIEFFGFFGIIIWLFVLYFRQVNVVNPIFKFFIGTLPNLGAAWLFTMIFKSLISDLLKLKYNYKIHFIVCVSVFIFALISELFHDIYLNSSFDYYDILLTFIAQCLIFLVPMMLKDSSLYY